MDYDEVMRVLSAAGFMYCEPLCVCSFDEAVNYPLGFVTTLPSFFSLPPIKDRRGCDITHAHYDDGHQNGQRRMIFKRKIDKFSERKPMHCTKNKNMPRTKVIRLLMRQNF